ncbi:MAG TPA: hypothetical protein VII06_31155 [Chloroflexota bacterium]
MATTLLGACASPAAGRAGDAAWWLALGQPPDPATAVPLAKLADGAGATAADWAVASDAGDTSLDLCHGAGTEASRALPDGGLRDFELRVRARTEPGAAESYGVAFRQQGPDEYFLARVDTRNNNVRLYRRSGGNRVLLTARDLGISVGQWHELAVRAAGTGLAVALDGGPVLEAGDDHAIGGGLALWAGAGTRVCFNGVWLTPRGAGS